MTQAEFQQLVRDMRAAQKLYYRVKTESALQAARVLEAKVDKELAVADVPMLPWK